MKKRDKGKTPPPEARSGMGLDAILAQLASLKDNSRSFIVPEPDDPEIQEIWKADVEACEAATAILSALQDEGIKDPEEVQDLIADYNALAQQYQTLHRKFEAGDRPERLGASYICPRMPPAEPPRQQLLLELRPQTQLEVTA